MFEKMRDAVRRMRSDERVMRRIYAGCTVGALLLSAGILAAIARGERAETEAAALPSTEPSAAVVSVAPEGETPPLTLELDEGEVTAILRSAVGREIPVDDVVVRFYPPGRLEVSANLGIRLPQMLVERAKEAIAAGLPEGWRLSELEIADGRARLVVEL